MGDPKKQRKKYTTPRHPWEAERIKEEKVLLKEFGLKNKKEVWKMGSVLKNIKAQTKELISRRGQPQAASEEKKFLEKLAKLNLIAPGAKIEDVLDIQIRDVLERRLQTQLLRKGYAKTPKQARQFIIHGHVMVNGKKLDVPSYLISRDEENKISFVSNSNLADEEHPERKKKESKKVDVKTQLEVEEEAPEAEKKVEKQPPKEKPKVEKKEAPKEEKPKEKPKEEKKEKPKVEKPKEKKEAPKEEKPKEEKPKEEKKEEGKK